MTGFYHPSYPPKVPEVWETETTPAACWQCEWEPLVDQQESEEQQGICGRALQPTSICQTGLGPRSEELTRSEIYLPGEGIQHRRFGPATGLRSRLAC